MRYSYELFCQRKRFLIKNYFTIYPDASYEDFCLFLSQRSVIPPSKDFFNGQKEDLFKTNIAAKSEEVTQEEVQEVKKPRRRRRSAKKNDS
tara:strand:+ start:261 stop:533 length:273 start_codon:yes stop_codon:yes gene_type:complete